uniref:Replication enhancer n=1 Tax=Turnip curly top virus TaxID=859650 RepID=L0CSH0_9GEMI|nr:C3 [Turnip curly top virus]ALR86743.1 C3 [Turnip curly top virus]
MNVVRDLRTGEPITHRQSTIGTYIHQVPNPFHLKLISWTHQESGFFNIRLQLRFNYNLRKQLGLHMAWIEFTVLGRHRNLTGQRFTTIFLKRLLFYLNNYGIISLNLVINSISHVLFDDFNFVESVIHQEYRVAMKEEFY